MGDDIPGLDKKSSHSTIQETFYEVLGVSSSASKDEIKESYKLKLLNSHPDKVGRNNVEHRIAEFKEAYRVLVDDSERYKYDEVLKKLANMRGFDITGEGLDVYDLDDFEEESDEGKYKWSKDCPRCQARRSLSLDESALESSGTANNEGGYDIIVQCESCSLWVKVKYFEEELSDVDSW